MERIHTLPGIRIEGLFTHFSKADESDKAFTELQYRRYMEFNDALKQRGIEIPVRHCANSAAIMDLPQMGLDAVRAGISMYGIYFRRGEQGDAALSGYGNQELCDLCQGY